MQFPSLNGARFAKFAFTLAVVIVLNLFYVYAVGLVYEEPKYETFCLQKQVMVVPQTKDECVAEGGQWTEDPYLQKPTPRPVIENAPVVPGYCNVQFTCSRNYDDTRKVYERNFFIALVILGVATLLGSFALSAYGTLMAGLSFGGVMTLVVASIRYWSNMDDYLRVIVLGIALAALIYVGARWFKDRE